MSKLTLVDVTNLNNDVTAVTTINSNSDAIETALENTLSRDGTSPNQMEADLDMNSNRILNLPAPVQNEEPLRLADIASITQGDTGPPGPQGDPGQGVAAGGTAHQALTKVDATDYNTQWETIDKTFVGLDQVDNTSDANKPVSTAQAAAIAVVQSDVDTHEADTSNPHSVTKAQVGLGNVDNTADVDKPVSTAQAAAIAVVQADVDAHEADTANPHSVTKAQVGLSNVDNTSDATKNSAVAVLTNKDLTSGTNTFPTFNQNTTGSAGTLNPGRNIDGQLFNGSADITVIAPGTHAATSKATPVDADELPLVDSAASNVLKKLTWANLKTTLNTYIGGLYLPLAGGTMTGSIQLTPASGVAANFSATVTGGGAMVNNWIGEGLVNQILNRTSSDAVDAAFVVRKRRGTNAANSDVVQNDALGRLIFQGLMSGADTNAAQIEAFATAATPSSSARDTRLITTLGTGSSFSEIMRLEHATGMSMFGANPVIDQNRHFNLRSYTVGTLPSASTANMLASVSDEGGGSQAMVYSDGTNWRRTFDQQVASTTLGARGLLAKLSVRSSFGLEQTIRRVYQKLADTGLTSKLLGLWVFAMPNQADALLNWITLGTRNLTANGSLTFTAGQGFTGDGATGYLDAGAAFATFGASQDSVSAGVYIRTAGTSVKSVITSATVQRTRIQIGNAGNALIRLSSGTDTSFAPTSYTGLFTISRVDAANQNAYLNESLAATSAVASAANSTGAVRILGDGASNFSDAQLSLAYVGTGLTATDVSNLKSILVDDLLYNLFKTSPTPYNSGKYTPTLNNTTNVAASTAYVCQWMRVGSTVTVSGKVDIDPTAATTDTVLGMSLPVTSNIANAQECAGTFRMTATGAAGDTGWIEGDPTNDRALFKFYPSSAANNSHYFTFTYQVI